MRTVLGAGVQGENETLHSPLLMEHTTGRDVVIPSVMTRLNGEAVACGTVKR